MTRKAETRARARAPAAAAAAWAALALGGCTAGPLEVDLLMTDGVVSMAYRLDRAGKLDVIDARGDVEGRTDETVYTARLDAAAIDAMKRVVVRSRVLLADSPGTSPFAAGAVMRLEVKLGLWHNVVRTRGAWVRSVGAVVGEINRHLPANYRVAYAPPPDRPGSRADPWKSGGDLQWRVNERW